MNRKGQLAMLGIMLAVLMFIAAIVFIEPIRDQITFARNSDNLDCENESLSTGGQMSCIVVDWQLPIFLLTAFAVAVGFIGLRSFRAGGGQ